jgi:hypothetical protein
VRCSHYSEPWILLTKCNPGHPYMLPPTLRHTTEGLKRNNTQDMSGRVALVTGARVKIGYEIALRLLRCGARVLVQTRFAHDAAARYSIEPDYKEWKHRLKIFGVDFRDVASVHRFTHRIKATEPRLDIIINNAAQTVRKPVGFYQHLLPVESAPLPPQCEGLARCSCQPASLAPTPSPPPRHTHRD